MKTPTIVLVLALSVAAVQAHDARLHHEKPITGTIASVEGDRLHLTTPTGVASLTLDPTTKLEAAGQPVARDMLQSGIVVDVFGTKLPGGEVAAREIHVHPAGDAAAPTPHGTDPPERR